MSLLDDEAFDDNEMEVEVVMDKEEEMEMEVEVEADEEEEMEMEEWTKSHDAEGEAAGGGDEAGEVDFKNCTFASVLESDIHDTVVEIGEVLEKLCIKGELEINERWSTPTLRVESVNRLVYITQTIFKMFHERLSPRKYKLEDGDSVYAQPPAIWRVINDWSSFKNLTPSVITLGILDKFRKTADARTDLIMFCHYNPDLCNHPICGGITRALDVMIQRIEQSVELSAEVASGISMLERMPFENATLKTLPPGMVISNSLVGELPPAMQAIVWLRRKWSERGFAHIGSEVYGSIQVQRVPGNDETDTEKVWMFTPSFKRIGTVEEVVRFECSVSGALQKLVGPRMKEVVGALSADGQTAFPNLVIMRNIWVACGRRSLDCADARALHIWENLKEEMKHMLKTRETSYCWFNKETKKRTRIEFVEICKQIEQLMVCQQIWKNVEQNERIKMLQTAQKLKKGVNVHSDEDIVNFILDRDGKMDHTFHPMVYPPYENLKIDKSATNEEVKRVCDEVIQRGEGVHKQVAIDIKTFLVGDDNGFERSRYDNHMITKFENSKIPSLFKIAHDEKTGIPKEKIQHYSGSEDSNNVRIIQIGDNMKRIIRPKVFTMDEWNKNPPFTEPATVIGSINWIGSMQHTRCAEFTKKGLKTMENINNDEDFVVVPTSSESREFLVNDGGNLLPSRGGKMLHPRERPTDDMWEMLFGWVRTHPAFEVLNKVLGDQEFKLSTMVHFIAFAWGMHLYDQKFSLELFTMVWGVAGSGKTSCVADILSLILGPYMLQMRDNQGNDFAKGEMRDSSRFCMWLAEEKEDSHQNSKGSMMSIADILRHVSGVGSHNPVKFEKNFRFDEARQTLLTTGNNAPHTLFSSSMGGSANNRIAAMFRRIIAFRFPVSIKHKERNIQHDMKHWIPFFIMAASEVFQMFLVGSMGKEMKTAAFFDENVRVWSSVGNDFPLVEALGLVVEKTDNSRERVTVGAVVSRLRKMHGEGRLVNLEAGMRDTISRSSDQTICDMIINLFSLDCLPSGMSGMVLNQSTNKEDKKNYKISHAVMKKDEPIQAQQAGGNQNGGGLTYRQTPHCDDDVMHE